MKTKGKTGNRVDWNSVRERVQRAAEALSDTACARDEEQRILRERVALLAKPAKHSESAASGETIDVLVFVAGGERYGFETGEVAQVFPMLPITPIPGAPGFVVGVAVANGEVLSVIDLRSLLDLPLVRLVEPTAVVMLRSATMEFGLLVDEIVGIQRYQRTDLEVALQTLGGIEKTYLHGVAPDRTAILDAARMLDDPRLVVQAG